MPGLPPLLATRFRDPSPLGSGAFGRVLRVTRIEDGLVVALKLLAPGISSDPELRLRFQREAEAGTRVDSPRVVRVLETGVLDEPYLAMEYVPGPDLDEELRLGGGRLSPDRADAVFDDVLAGLEAVHQAGMLHRDLKPANVLLGEDGRARLTDFGLVRMVGEETLTRTGMVLGTPLYMAPEQMMGEKPSEAWDLYSAAALYLELWTRAEPFPGGAPDEILAAKLRGPSDAALVGLPSALASFFRAALAADPTRRPRTVAELRKTWHAARAGGWGAPSEPDPKATLGATVRLGKSEGGPASVPGESPPPAPRRGLWWAACLAVLAIWLWFVGPRDLGPPPPPESPAVARLSAERSTRLLELPERLRQLPAVHAVLEEFQGPVKPSNFQERWTAAVTSLRGELSREGLDTLAEDLPSHHLRRDELDALGQAVLVWWLFSRTRGAGGDTLHEWHPTGELLEAALQRHTGARDEERISPWVPALPDRPDDETKEYRAASLKALRLPGEDWAILYGGPSQDLLDRRNQWTLFQPEGFPPFHEGRIRKTTLLGERFPPAQEGGLGRDVTVFVRDMSEPAVEIARHEAQEESDPNHETMHFPAPWSGPLELVVVGHGFDETAPLLLSLLGEEETLRVPVLMPLPTGRPDWASEGARPRTPRRLRLPFEVLPAGLHTIEARIHGIQSMGAVIQGAVMENVYLRLDAR